MSDDNALPPEAPAENGWYVPAHGKGRLRPFQRGQSGNPTGHSGRYGEVQRIAAEASPEAMKVLIGIMRDADEETRARIVAIEGILNRAFGRPREMQPEAAAPPLDLTAVSEDKLLLIIKALEAARDAKRAQAQGGEGDGGET